jgi:hypothetical protein
VDDGASEASSNVDRSSASRRPSHQAAGHGYPLGFAKSQWVLRDRLLVRRRHRTTALEGEKHMDVFAVHEAMARALDWERLLGSFNHAGEDRFPLSAIDRVAHNLCAWLDYQGFVIVVNSAEAQEPLPMVKSRVPMVFDIARKIVVLVTEQEEPTDVSHK